MCTVCIYPTGAPKLDMMFVQKASKRGILLECITLAISLLRAPKVAKIRKKGMVLIHST